MFWAERVIELDAINPQVAARRARAGPLGDLAEPDRSAAREAIARVAAKADLSDDVREVVDRALPSPESGPIQPISPHALPGRTAAQKGPIPAAAAAAAGRSARACKRISRGRQGRARRVLGTAASENVQGEDRRRSSTSSPTRC